ncbi:MAG TPA: EF2563 family selenium-dependent molybdenum hydroxylase system protein [Candidatus Agathobaculum merdigallinarum]|nr:EF2563 family selenium-dependent molybdenum hydroxylase system protein [Candidatus Agathobaculum merdigallinarum]
MAVFFKHAPNKGEYALEQENRLPWVLVRGAGDLATGVIVRLHRCGFKVIATESANPSAIRRRAALCEAVWQGTAQVEGVTCRRIECAEQAEATAQAGEVPLLVDEHAACATKLHPAAVVDAILAKRNLGTHCGMAPITIGLGPGFTAGQDVDAVVETMRGHHLGRIIRQGAAAPDTGVPGVIAGYADERVIHAPASGAMAFVTAETGQLLDIGALVRKGQLIARVGDASVYATIDGVLRGLIRAGYPVKKGLKIADIDPRPEQAAYCDTVSDKARAIGGGVVEALLEIAREKGLRLL